MTATSVYLIGSRSGRPLKIGVSNNAARRLTMIQTGHPYRLRIIKSWDAADGGAKAERRAHKALEAFRLSGEWFSCSISAACAAIDAAVAAERRAAKRRKSKRTPDMAIPMSVEYPPPKIGPNRAILNLARTIAAAFTEVSPEDLEADLRRMEAFNR